MKVPNFGPPVHSDVVSLSRLQNEGSQPRAGVLYAVSKSIKATE